MKKKIIIGLILATLLFSLLPSNIVFASISISSPTGQTYNRGDTVAINALSYADSTGTIQIQRGSTIVWIDQDTFSPSLSYSFTIPSNWGGGTYTIYIKGDVSPAASTTFIIPTIVSPAVTGGSSTAVTVSLVESKTPTQAATIISDLPIDNASTIICSISTTFATQIIPQLSLNKVVNIFETAVEAGNATQIATIVNDIAPSTMADILLDIDPEDGASLVEAMTTNNLNAAAIRVEEAVKKSGNAAKLAEFGGTLAGVPASTLVSLFREIVGLPATPSTVAELFEVMSITKVIDIVDAWMATEDYEGLATVFSYLSDEKLEEVYLTMSGAQRTTLYPYLDAASQARLPEQGELTVSNLSIEPETVEIGEIVTISVTVTNDGLIEFTEGVTLKIGGISSISIESEMVTLMPDESETLTWTVSEADPGTYSVDVNGLTGSFTVEAPPEPVPANIIYNSIGVSPTSVEAGDPVTVTVTLENTGELSGIESVELAVNGDIVDIKDVTVAGGDTESTTFTVTEDEPGTYTTEAGGKSATFTVTEPPPPPAQFPWTYVVIAVVLIAVAAYIYMQQQKQ